MREDEYTRLALFENDYWWFVAKRSIVKQCLERYLPAGNKNLILDMGCGTGATLNLHQSLSPLAFGFDYAVCALNYARRNHAGRVGQANILNIPVADNSFNALTCLDVLYHQWVADNAQALSEMYRVLKPGGLLIISNPAFNILAASHDQVNLAARRFRRSALGADLKQAGFSILKESYIFALLFPIALLKRSFQRKFSRQKEPASDIQPLPGWLNSLLLGLFQFELSWLKFASFPFGASVLMVAQK